MVRIAIDGFVQIMQVRAQWSGNGFGSGESSWSFMLPAAAGDVRELVLDRWLTYLSAAFIEYRDDTWRLDRVLVEDRWPQERAALVADVRLDASPPGTGNGMPPQMSPVISWRTGDIGRSNRGRTYLGPYTSDSASGSFVVGDASSAVHDFGESMMTHFTGTVVIGEPQFVIVSRQEDGAPIVPGAYSPVSAYQTFNQWAVQRRRERFDWRS